MSNFIEPGKTVGIIGGGQLALMLTFAAKKMGYQVAILDPDRNCAASIAADWQIQAAFNDKKALMDFAMKSDVLTYTTDLIDPELVDQLSQTVSVPQGSDLLAMVQDRMLEKAYLEANNINIAPYVSIVDLEDLKQSIPSIGYPCVLKTLYARGDRKDEIFLQDEKDISKCARLLNTGTCVLESIIPFEKELSIIVSRNGEGKQTTFPVVENTYRDGVLHMSIAPARIEEEIEVEVQRIGHMIAERTGLVGTMGLNLFVTSTGTLYVNTVSPYPNESGYYTTDSCSISTFEAHIRAICNWPMPEAIMYSAVVVVAIIPERLDAVKAQIQLKPDWRFHFYDSSELKKYRNLGYVLIPTDDRTKTIDTVFNTSIWEQQND